jgi:hypothetical protein
MKELLSILLLPLVIMRELIALLLLPLVILIWAILCVSLSLARLFLAAFYRVQAFITGRPLQPKPPETTSSVDP